MTDREMLELAAKAAGIVAQWDCPDRGMMTLTPSGVDTMTWNPLTDDGDALRLAVRLSIRPNCAERASADYWLGCELNTVIEELNGDPYAATRRAIVRAAAEIGKNAA